MQNEENKEELRQQIEKLFDQIEEKQKEVKKLGFDPFEEK